MTQRRKPRNLTLSDEARGKAEILQKIETRASLSNLVEALIIREHARLTEGQQASGKAKKEEVLP